ncbi:MAG: GrdX family protein [bacterium]|nr:GrdX family protein [bacterium]
MARRNVIITNNPIVATSEGDVFVESFGVMGVLEAVRNHVHLGHSLLTHPFSGSVKPNENPYRSVVVSLNRGPVDLQSVKIIEGCLEVARRMLLESPYRPYSAEALADLALIDDSLLLTGLSSLAMGV